MSVRLSRKCICSFVFAAPLRLSPAFWKGVILLLLGPLVVPLQSETTRAKRYLIDVWPGEQGLPQNTITGIAQTSDGYLWITTLDGVARFDGVRFRMFKAGDTPALGSGRIRFLLAGQQGELWLATQEGGLIQLEDGRFTPWHCPSREASARPLSRLPGTSPTPSGSRPRMGRWAVWPTATIPSSRRTGRPQTEQAFKCKRIFGTGSGR